MKYNVYILLVLLIGFSSCEEFLDPKISDERTYDQLITQPDMVSGLVYSAYSSIPSVNDNQGGQFLDVATDNALTNDLTNGLNRMVEFPTYWSATNNPVSSWDARYKNIKNINLFFDIMEKHNIIFKKSNEQDNLNYTNNLFGEAYFLRAWAQFDLLRRFGGVDRSGVLAGYPIVDQVYSQYDYPQLSRDSYGDCVQQILSDLNMAMTYLPTEWDDSTDPYTNNLNLGRPTDLVCMSLKSRVLLYAASPANDGSEVSWIDAADAAVDVLNEIGLSLPDVYGNNISNTFFNDPQNAEIICRRMQSSASGDRGPEERNFPPSYYGNGKCNPTQNLVDAFPMADGYPYDETNDTNMYENRDPRFYNTILYNGVIFKGNQVEVFNGGKDMVGGPNATIDNSTRTGYYLRKWLSNSVSLVPGNESNAKHYGAFLRKVEIFLNFAEAANEAVGPDVQIGGVSAREAIAEVRRRAGIAQPDAYLASLSSQEELRVLIKNERRIELCFEGHRFFDLRRWKDNLNTMLQKIDVQQTAPGEFTYTRVNMFNLAYDNSKFYGPIPLNELNKTDNITQNQGW